VEVKTGKDTTTTKLPTAGQPQTQREAVTRAVTAKVDARLNSPDSSNRPAPTTTSLSSHPTTTQRVTGVVKDLVRDAVRSALPEVRVKGVRMDPSLNPAAVKREESASVTRLLKE
jgi:hypothetical protein